MNARQTRLLVQVCVGLGTLWLAVGVFLFFGADNPWYAARMKVVAAGLTVWLALAFARDFGRCNDHSQP